MFYPEQLEICDASGTPTLDVVHHCDALSLLRALPTGSVDCVVTSPPYYALRDYGVDGQIGLEATPVLFIERLMVIFREVRRVLKPSGTCWVNLGDSYSGGGNYQGIDSLDTLTAKQRSNGGSQGLSQALGARNTGLPPKSLMMIPARFAIAMQDDGWILRSEIVWAKKAPMPESVTDRPTKAHEMIYMFAKEPRYFYDQEAVREVATGAYRSTDFIPNSQKDKRSTGRYAASGASANHRTDELLTDTRNLRDVWHLSPEPSTADHYAAYPTEIPRRCILAGCPEKVCSECGKPWERVVEKTGGTIGAGRWGNPDEMTTGLTRHGRSGDMKDGSYTRLDRGLHPACPCNAATRPGIALDMFAGTGTTALVARNLGRHYIGCDLSPAYVELARHRLAQTDPFISREVAPGLFQKSLFAGVTL